MSASLGELWFQSREFRVSQSGDVLEVRRRPLVLFVLAFVGLVSGLGMRLLGSLAVRHLDGGVGKFLMGGGALIGVAAAILVVLGVLQLVSPGMAVVYRLDRARRQLSTQRERFPLSDVTGWELTTMLGGYPAIRFSAATRSQYLLSVEPAKAEELKALLVRLQAFLGAPEPATVLPAHAPTPVSRDPMNSLGAWVLIGLGILWSGGGYFAFAGLSVTDARGTSGPPIWTFGLFFLALGLFRLIRSR